MEENKREGAVYERMKHLHPPRGWEEQVVRILHGKTGGETDRSINLVVLHREGDKIDRVVLKI